MHEVAVVALPGVVPFDLATPCEVLGRATLSDGQAGYRVRVCSVERQVDAGYFSIGARHGLSILAHADTVVLPGVADITQPVPPRLLRALRSAAACGARVASICTGAFVLAATGLLDGRRATTHWLAAAELARMYPKIEVDPQVLYVDAGQFLSSAGAAAGLDLCLHLVRRDYGAAVAAQAARISVMPLERDGGQSQFIVHVPPIEVGLSMEPLLRWQELGRAIKPRAYGAASGVERAHAEPALSRATRDDAAPVALAGSCRTCAAAARDERTIGRSHRQSSGLRIRERVA